ncbi:hypothetical protein C8J56DRAFT_980449 [Mycena floridula]|nr:hypothetical protein C8J56DRAFT_980449 [Mycena floridula]
MPALVPVLDPPLSKATKAAVSGTIVAVEAQPNIELRASRIPRVILDADVVSGAMAAQLATSLLGHVLFLKSQVPFPVLQLYRIPVGKGTTKATKTRRELVGSFDTLSSHLRTTFSALSTAFARGPYGSNSARPPTNPTSSSADTDSTTSSSNSNSTTSNPNPSAPQAFMTFCLGPSIGTSKSRVVFAVDRIEAKLWGIRDDVEEEEEEEAEEEEEDDDDAEGEEKSDEEETESESALSRSSSPAPSHCSSRASSPASEPEPSPPPSRSVSPEPEPEPVTPVLHYSSPEEERVIKAADRLLSRTLANAEAEGLGMAAELNPTQTHILLRAPRRFSHPAWIPQQNISKSLDKTLEEFVEEAQGTGIAKLPSLKRVKRVEGVWIGCRGSGTPLPSLAVELDPEEDDEMIWWSWDGKIIGFSEW